MLGIGQFKQYCVDSLFSRLNFFSVYIIIRKQENKPEEKLAPNVMKENNVRVNWLFRVLISNFGVK